MQRWSLHTRWDSCPGWGHLSHSPQAVSPSSGQTDSVRLGPGSGLWATPPSLSLGFSKPSAGWPHPHGHCVSGPSYNLTAVLLVSQRTPTVGRSPRPATPEPAAAEPRNSLLQSSLMEISGSISVPSPWPGHRGHPQRGARRLNHLLGNDQDERVGVGPSRSLLDIRDSILTLLSRRLLSSKDMLWGLWDLNFILVQLPGLSCAAVMALSSRVMTIWLRTLGA